MLAISADTFPRTNLSYLAFRIAFQETFERITLSRQIGVEHPEGCGYLTEVPFLVNVPAHVQLDLLSWTWQKHLADEYFEADLVDESVVYAACETTAHIVETEPEEALRFLQSGPRPIDVDLDVMLASELRALHLNLSNEGDFLMISQFEDMLPDEARALKAKFRLDEKKLDVMFDVLGRWSLSPEMPSRLNGLLSDSELARIAFELNAV